MSDIIQRLKDTYSENPAKALDLLPELFQAADDGWIVEFPCEIIAARATKYSHHRESAEAALKECET